MHHLVFFGSSDYSLIILQNLLVSPEFKVDLVVTKNDKPVGRDQIITANPVAQFAKDSNLPLLQIEQFTSVVKSEIRDLKSDISLCVAFGPPFFDQEMIDIFPYGIVNIHPSPLPKYRGATPGPWQIINGETKSAVTFFQIDLLPDHGPIISQIPFDISPIETAESFYNKAFSLAASNLETILTSYIQNPKSVQEQDHSQKSYFPKLNKDIALINWSWDKPKIDRFVRALLPWPVAWTYVKNQTGGDLLKMKIFSFRDQPFEVQIEGKSKTLWSQIKQHYQLIVS